MCGTLGIQVTIGHANVAVLNCPQERPHRLYKLCHRPFIVSAQIIMLHVSNTVYREVLARQAVQCNPTTGITISSAALIVLATAVPRTAHYAYSTPGTM